MKLTFEKEESNEWYIVLPEWTGDKADLQMVCGADTLLDIISEGNSLVSINVEIEISNAYGFLKFVLDKKHDTPEIGGAMYYISSFYEDNFDMWLCDVTRFVFDGELPSTIYIYSWEKNPEIALGA